MNKMQALIKGFTKQLQDALALGQDSQLNPATDEIRQVVIAGMGGSGIGGPLALSLLQDELKVPAIVIKSYQLPAFVDKNTLFIAPSFSGNTEETIECLQKAMKAGAQCATITSGGKMLEMAQANELDLIKIPGGSESPRASIGYLAFSLMFILHHKDLISSSFINQAENLITLLEQEENEILKKAEKIGNGIKGYLPIIYSENRLFPVALRFQQQINENGKHLAHANEFPEMNHNEIVGWEHPKQVLEDSKVFFLKTDYDHPRIRERFKICRETFSNRATNVIELEAKGKSLLEQYFYLIHLTDWISYFLALANDADPFPVKAIDDLKKELSKK